MRGCKRITERFRTIRRALTLRRAFYIIRRSHRRRLKRQWALKTDFISADYNKRIKEYWLQYNLRINTRWHKIYSSRNGICDVRYIPEELYYTTIDRYFNDRRFYYGVTDKNYFSIWFSDIKQPKTVIRKINGFLYNADYRLIAFDDAINNCMENENIVIKPTLDSRGGIDIYFWTKKLGKDELIEKIQRKSNLIVQETIAQHEIISMIHPASINTIRAMTLLIDDTAHILSCVLRMGINGSKVDNASAGGITCGIRENGQLKDVAYSRSGIRYDRHPQGVRFNECFIPSFDKVKAMLLMLQEKMAHLRMISWDIAIGHDGEPILIEGNFRSGGPCVHQFNNGPLFGDLTDKVLNEVFLHQRRF
jgi:hypothetical protein